MAYKIAVVNQKGGISKTTTVSALAYVFAKKGYKVLAIDMDSQGSLSQLCQVYPDDFSIEDKEIYGIQDIFEYVLEQREEKLALNFEAIKAAIIRPKYKQAKRVKDGAEFGVDYEEIEFGFDLIAADTSLANYEILLSKLKDGGMYLKYVIDCIEENTDYDYILIDCPPALTTLSFCGISAATDGLIIPINLEVLSLRGTRNIVGALATIQEKEKNMGIVHKGILGLLKNRYIKRYKIQQEFNEIIDEFFPIPSFNTIIPAMTDVDKAHAKGWICSQYSKKAYEVYDQLADEIIEKEEKLKDVKESIIINEIGKKAQDILNIKLEEVNNNE